MPDYDPKYRRRLRIEILLAYLLIVVAVAVGFWKIGGQQDQLCRAAAENRKAIRQVVRGVDDLGTDLVRGGRSELTPEQQAALDRVDLFRDAQLQALDLPVCD